MATLATPAAAACRTAASGGRLHNLPLGKKQGWKMGAGSHSRAACQAAGVVEINSGAPLQSGVRAAQCRHRG